MIKTLKKLGIELPQSDKGHLQKQKQKAQQSHLILKDKMSLL